MGWYVLVYFGSGAVWHPELGWLAYELLGSEKVGCVMLPELDASLCSS